MSKGDVKLIFGRFTDRFFLINKPYGYVNAFDHRPSLFNHLAFPLGVESECEGITLVASDTHLEKQIQNLASNIYRTFRVVVHLPKHKYNSIYTNIKGQIFNTNNKLLEQGAFSVDLVSSKPPKLATHSPNTKYKYKLEKWPNDQPPKIVLSPANRWRFCSGRPSPVPSELLGSALIQRQHGWHTNWKHSALEKIPPEHEWQVAQDERNGSNNVTVHFRCLAQQEQEYEDDAEDETKARIKEKLKAALSIDSSDGENRGSLAVLEASCSSFGALRSALRMANMPIVGDKEAYGNFWIGSSLDARMLAQSACMILPHPLEPFAPLVRVRLGVPPWWRSVVGGWVDEAADLVDMEELEFQDSLVRGGGIEDGGRLRGLPGGNFNSIDYSWKIEE